MDDNSRCAVCGDAIVAPYADGGRGFLPPYVDDDDDDADVNAGIISAIDRSVHLDHHPDYSLVRVVQNEGRYICLACATLIHTLIWRREQVFFRRTVADSTGPDIAQVYHFLFDDPDFGRWSRSGDRDR